jgi:hypothetical protein
MRLLIGIIVFCGLAIWLFTPIVVPVKPDPRIPTFDQQMAARKEAVRQGTDERARLRNALAAGKLHEDPQRHSIRQAVLEAADRVVASPCDTQQRQALKVAFIAFLHQMGATHGDPAEVVALDDGTVLDGANYYNGAVMDAMQRATQKGCAD